MGHRRPGELDRQGVDPSVGAGASFQEHLGTGARRTHAVAVRRASFFLDGSPLARSMQIVICAVAAEEAVVDGHDVAASPAELSAVQSELRTIALRFLREARDEVDLPRLGRRLSQAGLDGALAVVDEVLALEAEARRERRIGRLRKAADLPPAKTMGTFNPARLPAPLADRLRELARGQFLERAVNVLAFGLPGVGKSHAACALGHALVEQGHSVLFRPAYQLVQELLAAKREVKLPLRNRQEELTSITPRSSAFWTTRGCR